MILNYNITGRRLREFRLYFGFTQKKMGEFFGVPRGTYSSWESKYKNKNLPNYVQKKALELSIELRPTPVYIKKESLFRRILKWIMHKK